jgi:hypothetical protein
MSFKSDSQISQPFTVGELTKHQNKQLVPRREMLYILVSTILANKVVEVVSIKESNELSENAFILEDMQSD